MGTTDRPSHLPSRQADYSAPASQVLRHLRRASPQTREALVKQTGLSPATVARTVSELVSLELVRERHELAETAGRGRPRVPVELARDRFACIGVYVGKASTTLAVGDLAASVLAQETRAHPPGGPSAARIAEGTARLLNRFLDRIPLAAAVTGPWDHLPIDPAELVRDLETGLGLPVVSGDHIGAIAGVEFIRRGYLARDRTLYLYMRNVAGAVTMVESNGRVETSDLLDLTHLPTSAGTTCGCGRRGCLEAAASDARLAARAAEAGVVEWPRIQLVHAAARAGDTRARRLLDERAAILGEAAALVRDLVRPERLVVLGQAFAAYPEALPALRAAYGAHRGGLDTELEVSAVGDELQATAACATALGAVFADPRRVRPARS